MKKIKKNYIIKLFLIVSKQEVNILENMEKLVPHDGAGVMLIEGNEVNAVRFSIQNKTISRQELMKSLSIPLNNSPILMDILNMPAVWLWC